MKLFILMALAVLFTSCGAGPDGGDVDPIQRQDVPVRDLHGGDEINYP